MAGVTGLVPGFSPALLKTDCEMPMDEVDWIKRWGQLVEAREKLAAGHSDAGYWDRRARSFARSTQSRADEFLRVLEPYLSPRKTLIDVGAGAGRHAVPLAERLEWVTAVEPSEGMRAHISPRDNITVIASSWEDADVAPADLVICSHVIYGVLDPVPFIAKLDRSARERVFVVMRETDLPHPAAEVRRRLANDGGVRLPRFSELFMVLLQMGIAPDVTFLSYPIKTRYTDMDEAMVDVRAMFGDGWDEAAAREVLEEILTPDGGELVYDGGVALSGVAHWQPRTS
jgi:SAM-dependent methyltransferase